MSENKHENFPIDKEIHDVAGSAERFLAARERLRSERDLKEPEDFPANHPARFAGTIEHGARWSELSHLLMPIYRSYMQAERQNLLDRWDPYGEPDFADEGLDDVTDEQKKFIDDYIAFVKIPKTQPMLVIPRPIDEPVLPPAPDPKRPREHAPVPRRDKPPVVEPGRHQEVS